MVEIAHPLLDQLRQFDTEAARRFPAKFDNGLGQMGLLIYADCHYGGHWCTPENSVAFAHTGGDGVHFSFIVQSTQVTEASPVIVTVPASCDDADRSTFVVADNLHNFLRIGLLRGFFALEQLAYDRDLTLRVYSSTEWQPTEPWHYSVGYGDLDENGQRIRDFLAERFNLTPLSYSTAEFEALQARYKPFLNYPPDDEW